MDQPHPQATEQDARKALSDEITGRLGTKSDLTAQLAQQDLPSEEDLKIKLRLAQAAPQARMSAEYVETNFRIYGAGAEILVGMPQLPLGDLTPRDLAEIVDLLREIDSLQEHFKDLTRHGCWCGPGHRCEYAADNLDKCCKTHDLTYEKLGVAADSMWSRDAIKKTVEADEALVRCAQAATGLDPEVEQYRSAVEAIFSRRAKIGRWLQRVGY